MRRRCLFGAVALALAAAGWSGGAVQAQDAPKPVVKALINQRVELPDMKMKSSYQGVFHRGGKFRLEGTVYSADLTGDEKVPIKMTAVCTESRMEQLTIIEDQAQLFTYDLAAIRKRSPMFQACRDLNPCAFGEAVQKAASKEALGEERLASGETVKAYKLSLDEARASAPIPGLQAAMPQPKYLKVWMAGDNLPRKVEAYDAKDKVFIFTSFENVESAEGAPDSAFAVVPPKDVLRIEMTEVVLELIEAQEKAGKKPAR